MDGMHSELGFTGRSYAGFRPEPLDRSQAASYSASTFLSDAHRDARARAAFLGGR